MKSGTGVSTTYTLVSSYTGSLHENSRLYTSREYDRETHLYFLRARYYSPSTGKFISRDPIGQNDQINLYTYVKNNPLTYTDLFWKAAKQFVEAYDNYNRLKDLIFKPKNEESTQAFIEWELTQGFMNLDANQRMALLSEFYKARNKAKELHYARNKLNTNLPKNAEEAKKMGWTDSTSGASDYHQNWVPEWKENDKWVSKDGHKEVVFSYTDGAIVTDVSNMGTYNFFKWAVSDPISTYYHFQYDVNPWKEWWSWPDDSTNK